MHQDQYGEADTAAAHGRTGLWSRRNVLGVMTAVLTTPGSALLREWSYRESRSASRHTGLPPRTVGLRSLGGQFRFDPPGLRVGLGESLTWLNVGDFHTVTAFHPDNAALFPGEIPLRIPEGAKSFHSGMLGLDAGSVFTHRFEQPGVYDYFCQPHYRFGMVGRVIVGDSHPRRPPYPSELNDAAQLQLPTVDGILGKQGRGFEWASRVNGVLLLRVNGADDLEVRARALEEALGGPAPQDILVPGADRAEFLDTLATFVGGAPGGDYERLVREADRLKSALY